MIDSTTRTKVLVDNAIIFVLLFYPIAAQGTNQKGGTVAKTKTPFLSMGSKGTVGGAITSQKHHGSTILRDKPIPTDPRSLPQTYQRWLVQDYWNHWGTLSTAQKQLYNAIGSRYHLTGAQYFLKYHLKYLPDIAGYWKLDYMDGATTPDSSRNNLPGNILGPSPTPGQIGGAAHFDGLNDHIQVPYNPALAVYANFSIVIHFYCTATAALRVLIARGSTWLAGWHLYQDVPANKIVIQLVTLAGLPADSSFNLVYNAWNSAVVTFQPTALTLYVNGIKEPPVVFAATEIAPSTHDLRIGRRSDAGTWWYKGDIDQVILYNRTLSDNEAYTHMERRYPE